MNTGTAQVKIWYPLDKINSYTTNTVVIVNENNLTLRTNVTLSSFFLLSCSKLQTRESKSRVYKKQLHKELPRFLMSSQAGNCRKTVWHQTIKTTLTNLNCEVIVRLKKWTRYNLTKREQRQWENASVKWPSPSSRKSPPPPYNFWNHPVKSGMFWNHT